MIEYAPFLNLLILAAIPFLVRLEHRITKLETKVDFFVNGKKDSG